jgi:hypothetical protein
VIRPRRRSCTTTGSNTNGTAQEARTASRTSTCGVLRGPQTTPPPFGAASEMLSARPVISAASAKVKSGKVCSSSSANTSAVYGSERSLSANPTNESSSSCSLRSSRSFLVQTSAAMTDPALEPERMFGRWPASSKTLITPTWKKLRLPPPLRRRAVWSGLDDRVFGKFRAK